MQRGPRKKEEVRRCHLKLDTYCISLHKVCYASVQVEIQFELTAQMVLLMPNENEPKLVLQQYIAMFTAQGERINLPYCLLLIKPYEAD